jgi:hypothetical protein
MKNKTPIIYVIAVTIFAVLSTVLAGGSETDFQLKLQTTWAMFLVISGIPFVFKATWMKEKTIKTFDWLYKKTGISSFQKQAEEARKSYVPMFGRAIGISVIIIGLTLLLKNYTELLNL